MSTPPDEPLPGAAPDDTLRTSVRVLQIIHLMLMAGVGGFFVFTLLTSRGRQPQPGDDAFAKIAFFASAVAAVVASVVPTLVASAGVKAVAAAARGTGQAGRGTGADAAAAHGLLQGLLGAYQSGHVVGMAILEGAAFFATFALRSGAAPWFPAGLIALMAWRFPTFARVADWIDARRAEIDAGVHG